MAFGNLKYCKYCKRKEVLGLDNVFRHECMVRDEVKSLIDRGNITLDEWQNFRGNSWEFEAMVPSLSNRALMSYGYTITSNCTNNANNTQRPCLNYDQALAVVLVPELLKRLGQYEDLRKAINEGVDRQMNEELKDFTSR